MQRASRLGQSRSNDSGGSWIKEKKLLGGEQSLEERALCVLASGKMLSR